MTSPANTWPWLAASSLALLPCLLLSWEMSAIVVIILMFGGIIVFSIQKLRQVAEELRKFARKTVEGVSLDKMLQQIHDFGFDAFLNVIGTIIGQLAMYGLPCTQEQRVLLFQSGMELHDAEDARQILMEPGGWKILLPDALAQFIFSPPSSTKQDENLLNINFSDSESNNSVDSADASDIYEAEKNRIRKQLFAEEVGSLVGVSPDGAASEDDRTRATALGKVARAPPPLPIDALGSVVKEVATKFWGEPVLTMLSRSKTPEIAGALTSALFVIHVGLSKRSRQLLWTFISGSMTVGVASAWACSMAVLLAKHHDVFQREGGRFPLSLEAMPLVCRALKEKCQDTRWRAIATSVALLFWFGRKRRSQIR